MKIFLRPTKITWITLAIFLVLNASFFLLGMFLLIWPLMLIPLIQLGWLYSSFIHIGIDVTRGSDAFGIGPNFLGWILVIIGTAVTLILYYFIASYVSRYYSQTKNRVSSD